MSESPIVGRHVPAPEDEPPADGVVLFDPTPRAPLPDAEAWAATPWWQTGWAVLALVVIVSGGAFAALRGRATPSGPAEPPPVAQLDVPQGGGALIPIGGGGLIGPVGSTLELALRAVGAGGIPMADTVIRLRVDGLPAVLAADSARTDRDGVIRTALQLPRVSGRGRLVAELAGSELNTELVVAAQAGAPALLTLSGGNQQQAEVGELLGERLAVTVVDEAGNPVPGADVQFTVLTGQGVVAPERLRTDSLGVASALWRLGPTAGTQEVHAQALDLDGRVAFVATALGRIAAGIGTGVTVAAVPVRVESRPFSIGGSHACALVGGSAVCRGANDRGQASARTGAGFVAVATGISHSCALGPTGNASCWGANDGGQLGDGSRTDRPSPTPVSSELRFSTLTAGATHTCALAAEGLPICWGENLSGQLGDGSRTDARFPRAVGGGLALRAIVAGWNHTCGLTDNGNAFCWGLNTDGQLGDGSRLDRLVPTLVRGSIQSLAAGSAHTCGVSGAQVLCWGDNRFGQLGDGTNETRPQPVAVQGLAGTIRDVVSGAVHTCALLADGSAHCWGQNLHGQLGDGTRENRNRATRVAGALSFQSLEAGGALTCGFTADGAEYCWGLNQNGQLGDGTRESRPMPTRVTR